MLTILKKVYWDHPNADGVGKIGDLDKKNPETVQDQDIGLLWRARRKSYVVWLSSDNLFQWPSVAHIWNIYSKPPYSVNLGHLLCNSVF